MYGYWMKKERSENVDHYLGFSRVITQGKLSWFQSLFCVREDHSADKREIWKRQPTSLPRSSSCATCVRSEMARLMFLAAIPLTTFPNHHTHSSCPFSAHAYHPSHFSLTCFLSLHHMPSQTHFLHSLNPFLSSIFMHAWHHQPSYPNSQVLMPPSISFYRFPSPSMVPTILIYHSTAIPIYCHHAWIPMHKATLIPFHSQSPYPPYPLSCSLYPLSAAHSTRHSRSLQWSYPLQHLHLTTFPNCTTNPLSLSKSSSPNTH